MGGAGACGIELEKRAERSKHDGAGLAAHRHRADDRSARRSSSPLLGKAPLAALYVYFIEPLSQAWSLQELVVKATPLVLIAIGLSLCYLSNNWNIGAEGQYVIGGDLRRRGRARLPGRDVRSRRAG